jgi:NADP-dependent 3-hydroxy acid dehydrogenase YdfG
LWKKGAYVFITGRRKNKLDEAVKAIGRNMTGVQANASNLADLARNRRGRFGAETTSSAMRSLDIS